MSAFMDERQAQTGRYAFQAGEHPDGHAVVTLGPPTATSDGPGRGILVLVLRNGAGIDHAEELASQLNALVAAVEYTP